MLKINLLILIKEYIVKDLTDKQRFIDYSYSAFADLISSNKGVKKAIKRGELLLNEELTESGRFLKNGDKIQLYDSEKNTPKTYDLELEIVFEDEYFAIINKPAGINVSGNMYRTIVNSLPYNLTKSTCKDALSWFRPVHRLDNQTSGLLIIAKTQKAMVELGRMFENKEIQKKYHAIVIGETDVEGVITKDIEGAKSITEYKVLRQVKSLRNKDLTLLELTPKTGRTHQIRIHLSEIGFPILGDKLYFKEGEVLKHKGLFLSAVKLLFKHPINGDNLNIGMDTPYKFNSLLEREERRYDTYHKEKSS